MTKKISEMNLEEEYGYVEGIMAADGDNKTIRQQFKQIFVIDILCNFVYNILVRRKRHESKKYRNQGLKQ